MRKNKCKVKMAIRALEELQLRLAGIPVQERIQENQISTIRRYMTIKEIGEILEALKS